MWLVTETRGLNPSGSTWFKQMIIQYKQRWATKAQGTSKFALVCTIYDQSITKKNRKS